MSKTELGICVECMSLSGEECTLASCKARHQDKIEELEDYLANRQPHESGEKLVDLSIAVAAAAGCIKTREDILGIAEVA